MFFFRLTIVVVLLPPLGEPVVVVHSSGIFLANGDEIAVKA